MNNNPFISIIINTKNEERIIEKCLDSINKQDYNQDDIEVIVIDNKSIDNTKNIAQKYTPNVLDHGKERSEQRNHGAKIAKGEWLLFVDADFVLSKNVLSEAEKKIKSDGDIVGFYIPLRWVGKNWIIKARGFEREFYDNTALDAVRIVKKDVFIKSGMFDTGLYAGEDWDMNFRLSKYGRYSHIDEVMYHYEDENISLSELISKTLYYSPNINVYKEKAKKAGSNNVNKQFSLNYRYFEVFMEDGKWKKVLAHPILFSQMYFLKILIGFYYVAASIKTKS
jgi:glycosyltransferase involved in cell wall biosynthesis